MKAKSVIQKKYHIMLLSLIFTSYVGTAHAIPAQLQQGFVNNINNGFYLLDDQFSNISNETHSPWEVSVNAEYSNGQFTASAQASGTIDEFVALLGSAWDWFKDLVGLDPQDATIFSSMKVDNVEHVGDLIAASKKSENVQAVYSLPNFLGGATYTATNAFGGTAFDALNNVVPGVTVGYGVLETSDGSDYFVATRFGQTPFDLLKVANVEYALGPVMPSGEVVATKLEMHAFENQDLLVSYQKFQELLAAQPVSVPEPSSLILLVAGLLGVLTRRKVI